MPSNPKYSYKTRGGAICVSCLECQKGLNSKQTCMKGVMVRNTKEGCFAGKLMDRYSFETEKKAGDQEER